LPPKLQFSKLTLRSELYALTDFHVIITFCRN